MTSDESQHPTVSVIMPTYNHAGFIGEAIRSVLTQTCGDFELIVVDNFSADDTESIVRGFNDPRIEYLKFANDGIIAASRNAALKKARGEFLAFLDSDDIWAPDKIETQLEHLGANPEIALVCGSMVTVRDCEPFDIEAAPSGQDVSTGGYDWLLDWNSIFCSSVIVRRKVLDEVGLFDEDPAIVSAEDWDLWLRIVRKHPLTLMGKQMGGYRIHGGNISLGDKRMQRIECVLRKHLAKGWITDVRLQRSMAYLSFGVGWACIEESPAEARRMFRYARTFAKGAPKISRLALLGLIVSFCPPICRFIKRRSIGAFIKRAVNLRKPADDSGG